MQAQSPRQEPFLTRRACPLSHCHCIADLKPHLPATGSLLRGRAIQGQQACVPGPCAACSDQCTAQFPP